MSEIYYADQVRVVAKAACVCAPSPRVTVAIRAEPHGPVLVRDSKAVKRVCSNHQEELKHLEEGMNVGYLSHYD